MEKEKIIKKIKNDMLGMRLRENYINHSLSEVYTKWYLDEDGNLYSMQAVNGSDEPEAAWKGKDILIFSLRPLDLDNVQFDVVDDEGKSVSDEAHAASLTDEEFLDAVFVGAYYDERYHYFVDCTFEEYLEHKLAKLGIG